MEKHDPLDELLPIGAVVELLQHEYPDISHSSLRFLEREGLIVPTRTRGGHRLFSADDLQRLRQIKDWQSQRLTLEQIRQRLAERDAAGTTGELAATFLEHALAGHVTQAQQIVLTAHDLGLSLDTLFIDVLRPALWELGLRWERKEISVAQEKEVSHIARDLIAELGLRASGAGDDGSGGVVAACVEGERHELGLFMVSGQLRARGLSVHFLGADVALAFLAESVRLRRPQAVILSVTGDEHLPALRMAAEKLSEIDTTLQILAGGQAVQRQPALVASWAITPIRTDDLEQLDQIARSLHGD